VIYLNLMQLSRSCLTRSTDFIQRLSDGVTGTTPITGTSPSTLSDDEELIMKLSKHLTARS